MKQEAVLRVPVRITTRADAQTRWYRLSAKLTLPPAIHFSTPFPIAGHALGEVKFFLPGDPQQLITSAARLKFDPEKPEQGSSAELINAETAVIERIQSYINGEI